MRKITPARNGAINLFTIIFLCDHDIPLTGSNFGNLTVFRAIFSHIFTAHVQEQPFMNFRLKVWHHHSIPWSRTPLPSNRHHRSCGDCLKGKGKNYQVCSVQYCVQQLCSAMRTHMNRLTVLWIGFSLTGPISLCLDWFLYCVLLCVVCMLSFVTRWGGPGGIEAYP